MPDRKVRSWDEWFALAAVCASCACVDMSLVQIGVGGACGGSQWTAGNPGIGGEDGGAAPGDEGAAGGRGGDGAAGDAAMADALIGGQATAGAGSAGRVSGEDSTAGEGTGAGGTAGGAAGSGTMGEAAGNAGCPGTGGPSMVRLPEGYCIDSTEVTRAQYSAWQDTNPSTEGQTSDCTWNTSFAPATSCINWVDVCRSDCDHHPQVCVDWCDAYAYCQAVGKRLCGRIGGDWTMWSDHSDASLSEWYSACTSHGTNTFPYGSVYDGQLCNGSDYAGADNTTVAVRTLSSCQSTDPGYAGVFDLNGNAAEWEGNCSGVGRLAFCHIRGGSFYTASNMACDLSLFNSRIHVNEAIGFRCCASP